MADTLNAPLNEVLLQQTISLPTTRRHSLLAGALAWSPKGVLALVDQGLISGANFIVGILLARHLAANQYGAYALAFQVYLFLSVGYAALVLEPQSVFGSSVFRDSNREYLGVLLRIHGVLAACTLLGLGACAWVLRLVSPHSHLIAALIGVAIASPCMLLFSLARRGFYVKLSPRQAALGALGYFAVVLGGLLLAYDHSSLSPFVAFLLMAAGAGVTAPMMLARLGFSLNPRLAVLKSAEVIRRHWEYGRWALASAVAIWFSSAVYFPFLGSLHGLAETGALQALTNFSSPIAQAFVAVSMLSLPYASRVYHQKGPSAARRLVWKLTIVYSGGAILYWGVLIVCRGPIVHLLYAGKYEGIAYLMPWIALSSTLRISASAHAITLRAMHTPMLVFVAYSGSCVAAVLIGVPCAWAFGLHGAVIALAFSSAVALIVVVAIVHRRSTTPANLQVFQDVTPGPLA